MISKDKKGLVRFVINPNVVSGRAHIDKNDMRHHGPAAIIFKKGSFPQS